MDLSFKDRSPPAVYGGFFMLALAATALVAVLAPRFLAYWPGIIGLTALLAYKPVFKEIPVLPKQPLIWCVLISLLGAVSSLWALDPDFALERTGKLALVLFSGMALVSVVSSIKVDTIRPYLGVLFWAIAVGCLLCALELLADYPLYRVLHGMDGDVDVAASNLNRSVISVLALSFAAVGIAQRFDDSKLKIGIFLLVALMLWQTHSQSAQLGFAMAAICYSLFPYSKKIFWHILTAILVLGLVGAPFLATWMFNSFAADIADMPFLGSGGGFGGERLEIWDAVARYAMHNPLYGFGMEAARAVEAFDIKEIYRESKTLLHPHNFALELWLEYGILGVLPAAMFFVFLIGKFSDYNYRQAQVALPSFLIILAPAAFGYGLWQSWFIGLMIITMSVSILIIRVLEGESPRKTSKKK